MRFFSSWYFKFTPKKKRIEATFSYMSKSLMKIINLISSISTERAKIDVIHNFKYDNHPFQFSLAHFFILHRNLCLKFWLYLLTENMSVKIYRNKKNVINKFVVLRSMEQMYFLLLFFWCFNDK